MMFFGVEMMKDGVFFFAKDDGRLEVVMVCFDNFQSGWGMDLAKCNLLVLKVKFQMESDFHQTPHDSL